MSFMLLGILNAQAAAGGFTPPGETWTYATNPVGSEGDVYYDKTFQKWYIGPRTNGPIYYSSDGTTWTYAGVTTYYNAGKFQRANDKLFFNAPYNNSGVPQSGYHYSTNGTTFSNNSGPFNGFNTPAEDDYGNYVVSRGESNYSDQYAVSTNGTTWSLYSTTQANDSFGSFSAGIYACWSDYQYVYKWANGSFVNRVLQPSNSLGRWSFIFPDKLTYIWDNSWAGNSRMWQFDGTSFTQYGVARPTTHSYEIGKSIAIIGEDLLPNEVLLNFATGFVNTSAARLWTPTYGYKYVLPYYPGEYGSAYSPEANMYIAASAVSNGSYYLMKSIG